MRVNDLDTKLSHLTNVQQNDVKGLLHTFKHLFSDTPQITNIGYHDVIVDGATPVKQHPYRVNPLKAQYLNDEIKYMEEHGIIEKSRSDWSSPCILVPKSDGSYRFCTDFLKVNSVTKSDVYPIPRIEDCIDKVGVAKYVSKFDLLKGYWQVPLTERAKEISAFVTPDGLYQYNVIPYAVQNEKCSSYFSKTSKSCFERSRGLYSFH
jgi:hypothetical protein